MIIVAGGVSLDYVVHVKRIPRVYETMLGGELQIYPGGKGGNQAVACVHAGEVPTLLLCAIGSDTNGEFLRNTLIKNHVQVHAILSQAHTGSTFINVDNEGNNAVSVAPGANLSLTAAHWHTEGIRHKKFTHLLLQLEIPMATALAYAEAAKQQDAVVVVNVSPLPDKHDPHWQSLMKVADWFILDHIAFASISAPLLNRNPTPTADTSGIEEIKRQLLALDPHTEKSWVITSHEHGAIAWHKKTWYHQGRCAANIIDTTAAADTFCGVFVAYLSRGAEIADALRYACTAATLACCKLGGLPSIPSYEEVRLWLANQDGAILCADSVPEKYSQDHD